MVPQQFLRKVLWRNIVPSSFRRDLHKYTARTQTCPILGERNDYSCTIGILIDVNEIIQLILEMQLKQNPHLKQVEKQMDYGSDPIETGRSVKKRLDWIFIL